MAAVFGENGGFAATTFFLFMPAQDPNNKQTYIAVFDASDNDDPLSSSTYSYRSEDVAVGRVPTIHRIILTFRDIGKATIFVSVSGTNDNGEAVGTTVKAEIGNDNPTFRILTKNVDLALTCYRPQLTIARAARGGPFSIISAVMCGEVEDVQL